jgi:hypothetical protein
MPKFYKLKNSSATTHFIESAQDDPNVIWGVLKLMNGHSHRFEPPKRCGTFHANIGARVARWFISKPRNPDLGQFLRALD